MPVIMPYRVKNGAAVFQSMANIVNSKSIFHWQN